MIANATIESTMLGREEHGIFITMEDEKREEDEAR